MDASMVKNLDFAYDEFLTAHEAESVQAVPAFLKSVEKTGPRFGPFAIPTFYKPHLIHSEQEHLIKRAASTLNSVLNTAVRLYFEERHLASVFRLRPEVIELISMDPGFSKAVVFSRFDGLLEGQSFKVLECNTDSVAGAAYADQLEQILLDEPFLKPFFEENQTKCLSRVQGILDSLLEVYEEFGGLETPRIAIMDWKNARTIQEFEMIKEHFETKGYKTTIADPRELRYKGGKLYHKDFRIDILYRRTAFQEIVHHLDEVQDMIKAYRDRAVCMVNPLRSYLTTSKAVLSILTNPAYDHFFTENENKIKHEYLPWVRRVSDAEAFYGSRKVFLVDFLRDEKESLVLKPPFSYGGKGVTIGRETRDQDWNEAIGKAMKEDWVIQEYVNVPIMTVPEIVNKKLDFAYKKYNFNALVSGGKFSGGFVRLSQESVVNVARKGGFIPSIVSEISPDRFEA